MTTLDMYLDAIAAGDTDAFAEWMAGAEHRVRASLSSFARHVDTESVMQECFLRMWQVAPRIALDGKPDSLVRFAIRTARNLAITELRKRRPDLITDDMLADQPAVESTEEPAFLEELREAILRCIEKLPAKPRRAIEARLRGRIQRDAVLANGVGMKVNTFLQNIRRARIGLTACLEESGIKLGFKR